MLCLVIYDNVVLRPGNMLHSDNIFSSLHKIYIEVRGKDGAGSQCSNLRGKGQVLLTTLQVLGYQRCLCVGPMGQYTFSGAFWSARGPPACLNRSKSKLRETVAPPWRALRHAAQWYLPRVHETCLETEIRFLWDMEWMRKVVDKDNKQIDFGNDILATGHFWLRLCTGYKFFYL